MGTNRPSNQDAPRVPGEEDGGYPGAVLGQAPIRVGESTSVEIPLKEPLGSTQRLYAMVHDDEPSDGTFTFPEDNPSLDSAEQAPATEPFRYAVSGATAGKQEEAGIQGDELPETGGVPLSVVLPTGAAMFLAGLALLCGAAAR